MVIVTYTEDRHIDQYTVIRTTRTAATMGIAFEQGDLVYFKLNKYEYMTIPKENILTIVNTDKL